MVDQLAPNGQTERTIVVFGLNRGGRSYYAIDIHDPFNPVLLWSLVPDEAATVGIPQSRILATNLTAAKVTGIVKNMGLSTSTPAFGRVLCNGAFYDAVFLGGGASYPEMDHNFPTYPNPPSAQNTPMGRQVIALDVATGKILGAVDLTATSISGPATYTTGTPASLTSIGPIASTVIPFEFFIGSGQAQRLYFLDLFGGLWSWGSKAVDSISGSSTQNYRKDTSEIDKWTLDGTTATAAGIRKVAQDSNTANVYTTSPAPFRVSSFAGVGKATGSSAPAAVGIAMSSGDRNNPLDFYYTSGNTPTNYRTTVVFDRQDSRVWNLDTASGPDTGILDSQLKNVTSLTYDGSGNAPAVVQRGNASYYLAPSSGTPAFGYYLNFPGITAGFFPKGISAPIVVSSSLFYSYFPPTSADPCLGGGGSTYSQLLCDVYSPVPVDNRSNVNCKSGQLYAWSGVASAYQNFGTTGALQGGAVPTAITPPAGSNASATTLQLQVFTGKQQQLHPKALVWRTVH